MDGIASSLLLRHLIWMSDSSQTECKPCFMGNYAWMGACKENDCRVSFEIIRPIWWNL